MAKPYVPPPLTIVPPTSGRTAKASYNQLRALWIQAGGDPNLASTMAAIAEAESSGTIANVSPKNTDGTIDRGLWQINSSHGYNNSKLISDPLYNARAAVAIYNSQGPTAWTTFNTGAYQAYFIPKTPEERATNDALVAQAKASNPAYLNASTNLTIARKTALASAEATAHASDSTSWVTVLKKNGVVVGFGQAFGAQPPANVLTIGGIPATKADYQLAWSNTYATDYTNFTGQAATPAVQAQILESGESNYTMMQNLAQQPGFTKSPIYLNQGATVADQVKQILGKPAPAAFVREAIVNSWDSTQIAANAKSLPGYEAGPVFQQTLDQAKNVYSGIYGNAPDPGHEAWLKGAIMNGWSQDEIAQTLRTDPAYTSSPEFAAKAYNLLSSLGLPTTAPAPMGPLPKTQPVPPPGFGVQAAPPLKTSTAPTTAAPSSAEPVSQAARAA